MSDERKQILDMLAEGKISAEEAERLLDRLSELGATGTPEGASSSNASSPAAHAEHGATGSIPKYLRVVVDDPDGDKVNIRVPLQLVRTGVKLAAMVPSEARDKLNDKGIDLSQFSGMDTEERIQVLHGTIGTESQQRARIQQATPGVSGGAAIAPVAVGHLIILGSVDRLHRGHEDLSQKVEAGFHDGMIHLQVFGDDAHVLQRLGRDEAVVESESQDAQAILLSE